MEIAPMPRRDKILLYVVLMLAFVVLFVRFLLIPGLENHQQADADLREALEKQGLANEIGLKWPNDLVARGRKLGGILVEAARDNEGKPFAVCGIGVNVNYVPSEVPDGGLPAIGLSDLNENVPAVDVLLKEVYHTVVNAVDAWAESLNAMEEDAGPLAPVHGEYIGHLNWIGDHVIARSPAGDELARGIFQTVDDFGRACIETEDDLRSFHFEEASLRPMGK